MELRRLILYGRRCIQRSLKGRSFIIIVFRIAAFSTYMLSLKLRSAWSYKNSNNNDNIDVYSPNDWVGFSVDFIYWYMIADKVTTATAIYSK